MGKNYLLVDWEGDIAVVERGQDVAAVRREHRGVMAVTNFCLHEDMIKLMDDSTEERRAGLKNAADRHARIMQLFADERCAGTRAAIRPATRGFRSSPCPTSASCTSATARHAATSTMCLSLNLKGSAGVTMAVAMNVCRAVGCCGGETGGSKKR